MIAIYTDADNTLWDTDGVYRAAQLGLLRQLAPEHQRFADDAEALAYVRAHDQRIAASHADGLRYASELLAKAIAADLGCNSSNDGFVADGHALYQQLLGQIPRLRTGVSQGLARLHAEHGPVSVVTETSTTRCTTLLEAHNLLRYVGQIVAERKTPQLFQSLRGVKPAVMIGDQLDRDVLYSAEAGYMTVYFPGNFSPFWLESVDAAPQRTVSSYAEIPDVIAHLNTSSSIHARIAT